MVEFEKKEGKREIYKATLCDLPYHIIVKKDEQGNILQIMEKPDIKLILAIEPTANLSGAHVILGNPTQSHYDNWVCGIVASKDYPAKAGEAFEFRNQSGAALFV